ncbi:hypothetical protein OM357_21930, partial [Escherichia albertii]|nr:hypothetical protein [Escherichia albertii]MCZ8698969.1 hypothetical protein [Escherichia albertii]MCZ8846410.1 hypothetical protein [Escherichia albertii]MCZ8916446.1 hypothetical protein [Escherichia albertii]
KARLFLSGKVTCHVWSEECCVLSLAKAIILLFIWACFVKANVIMRIIIDHFFMIKLFLTAISTINRGL